ncbi:MULTISPECIES: peptidoglycan-binding protein [unclassified Brevibacterium]|uniref:peptidoglycan-binding protein n=1 Tax=unclassified Brevibacterium TaxID=2614124 RepID=UPI001D01F9AA|nr:MULTISPECIES: peptidoglycan-binding protein [unclassified Brevibacterium]
MAGKTRHRNGSRSVLRGALMGLGAAVMALVVAAVIIVNSPVSFGSTKIRQMQMATVNQLTEQQIDNARLIIGIGRGGDFDDRAIRIALMTALQESSLRNLDAGDRDSIGLFQQRPSQGWGEPERLNDPIFATKSFYGINPDIENPGLEQIEDWHTMSPTEAAQAVQRSGLPDAYEQWESLADDLIGTQDDVEALS